MAPSFDPYVKWLAIRDPERPPNHYRLLGLDPFEDDPYVIACAADRQIKHVRQFLTGRHPKLCRQLLQILAQARACLLDEKQKQKYDTALRRRQEAAAAADAAEGTNEDSAAAPAELSVPPIDVTGASAVTAQVRTRRSRRSRLTPIVGGGVAALLVVGGVWYARHGDDGRGGGGRIETPPVAAVDELPGLTPDPDNPLHATPHDNSPFAAAVVDGGSAEQPDIDATDGAVSATTTDESASSDTPPTGRDIQQPASVDSAPNRDFGLDRIVDDETLRWYLNLIPEPRPLSPEMRRATTSLRRAMAQRDLESAQAQLAQLRQSARTTADQRELERLTELHAYWANFWDLFITARSRVRPGQQLTIDGATVEVTDARPEQLSVRTSGGAATWNVAVNSVKPEVAIALVQTKMDRAGPVGGACIAAMLAMDDRADRQTGLQACVAALGQGLPVDAVLVEYRGSPTSTAKPRLVSQNPNPRVRPIRPLPIAPDPNRRAPRGTVEPDGTVSKDAPRSKRPEAEAAKMAVDRVREIYKARFDAAKSDESRVELARFLLDIGAKTTDDEAAQFALLSEARRLAESSGDWRLVISIVGFTGTRFDIDTLSEKANVLKESYRSIPVGEMPDIRSASDANYLEAISSDRFELAKVLLQTSQAASRRDRSRIGRQRAEDRLKVDLPEFVARHEAAEVARATLADNPDDAASHAALGIYLCINRQDWQKGLPHLARGDDAALQTAAKDDLDESTNASKQKQKGDAWFSLAQGRKGTEKQALMGRASHWYQRALPSLSGLSKDDAERKIEQIASAIETATSAKGRRSQGWIDLLSEVRSDRDVIAGRWQKRDDGLLAVKAGPGTKPSIALRATPRGSYQLDVGFTGPDGTQGNIVIWLPIRPSGCLFVLNSQHAGIGQINGQGAQSNASTFRFQPPLKNRRHALSIRVTLRGDRVSIASQLDDKPFVNWEGPIASLTQSEVWRFPNPRELAIGSWAGGIVIHDCRYRPLD